MNNFITKKLKLFISLFSVILIILFISVCAAPGGSSGGGGGDGEVPEPGLPPKLTVLGSDPNFNYTIITAQLSSKPESNSAPTTAYSYSIFGTPGTLSIVAPIDVTNKNNTVTDANDFYGDLVYSSKQSNNDLFMREMENQLLSSKTAQVSKRKTGILASPDEIDIGDPWNGVYVYDGSDFVQIDTTCQYISDHAYFFVDNRNIVAMSGYLTADPNDYGATFDAIYDVNHDKFGTENDTDDNNRVIIIFSEELSGGFLGYFYAVDKFPKTSYPESNEGDIFYMTTNVIYQGDVVNATLAHEFQHMIYFDEHYGRGVTSTFTWLNEALSQAAEYYNNYTVNHLDWIEAYLNNGWAGLSLTHWRIYNYGYGALFIRYLIDQYGDAAIKNMCATNQVGIAAVENATGADFNTIFDNFTRALVLDEIPEFAGSPEYNFTSLNLQTIQPAGRTGLVTTEVRSTSGSMSGSIYPYRIVFAHWDGIYGNMTLYGNNMVCTVFRISN